MTRTHSIWLIVGVMAAAIIAAAAHGGPANSASKASAPTEIMIDNFSFAPVKVTVPVGTTVQWTNRDDIPHTVVSEDHVTFKSQVLDTNQGFNHTFTKPGTYRYFCSLHPRMEAEIVVGE